MKNSYDVQRCLAGKKPAISVFCWAERRSALRDKYRGVFSCEALRSRLSEGRFATESVKDLLSPIIRLSMLTHDEMYVLIEKLMQMHGQLFEYEPEFSQEELLRFLDVEYNRVGAQSHITPREIIRDFIELLNILLQNPGEDMEQILSNFATPELLGKPTVFWNLRYND